MVEEDYGYKKIWAITYPLILSGISQTIINISDTIFLGRLSELALGAAAIAGLYYVTFYMLGVGFSIGSQILIARFQGESETEKVKQTFQVTSALFILIAFATFLCLHLASPSLLKYLIKSDQIYAGTLAFLRFRVWGIFPGFGLLLFRSFYSGIGSTKIIGYSTAITAVLNLLFNYGLVFGNFGLPRWNIEGSGLASTLAETLSFIFVLIYTRNANEIKYYRLFSRETLQLDIVKQLTRISIPLMIQVFISLISWFAFFFNC